MTQPTNNSESSSSLLVALNTREAHLHLLRHTYPQLAAFAWDNYRQTGKRGGILLNELEVNRFLARQDKELKAQGIEAGIDAFDLLALPGGVLDESILLLVRQRLATLKTF